MDTSPATWQALFSKTNALKALVLALGVMLHATNVYIATTIMPSIVQEIGGLEYYAWNTTLFVVASVIGSVISTHQMALFGPRRAYQISIVLFSLGTLLCTLAPTMYILLFGRFIQGYGGGLLFALSYAMIRLVFAPNLWSRAMALISGMWGIAAFSGPFIGGVFATYGHWRWSFGSLLFFCLFIFIVASAVLPKQKNTAITISIPYLKLILLSLSIFSVAIGSTQKELFANFIGLGLALFFLLLLVVSEKNSATRLLPTGAYKISTTLGSTYAVMALLTIATSIEIYVPYFAQTIHHFTPLEAGYLTVLIAVGWTLSSLVFSGYKSEAVFKISTIGACLMLLGLVGLGYLNQVTSLSSLVHLLFTCLLLFAIGAGIGMGWPHLLTKVFSLAPKGEEDLTASSVTTLQLIATSFGAALAGLVTNLGGITDTTSLEGVTHASIYLYFSFALAPLLALFVLVRMRYKTKFKP